MLFRSHPEEAKRFLADAGHHARERFRHYKELADLPGETEAAAQAAASASPTKQQEA